MADAAVEHSRDDSMTEAQREAHKRLMQILPVRTIAEEVENWAEENRPLSEEELVYLLQGEA